MAEYIVGGKSKITLDQSNYVASGGEADIYKQGGKAWRVHQDINSMPPVKKLEELALITVPNVVKPLDIIYDKKGTAVGFSMKFLDDTEPLCLYFTNTFKKAKKISPGNTIELVKAIQSAVNDIMSEGVLPVDLNEMNILVENGNKYPWFIDISSWATKSFKATAIMDNIRDPKVNGNNFNILSTWYSFAILATQLYLGTHPFFGKHPRYSLKQWKDRMRDSVSIFDKDASMPDGSLPVSVIPPRHLSWLKDIFVSNNRVPPPTVDGSIPLTVPKAITTINIPAGYSVNTVVTLNEKITEVFTWAGNMFVVGQSGIYQVVGSSAKKIATVDNADRVFIQIVDTDNVVLAYVYSHNVRYEHIKLASSTVSKLGEEVNRGIFQNNNKLYTISAGQVHMHDFRFIGEKLIHAVSPVSNVSQLTTKDYEGCAIQSLFNQKWVVLPLPDGQVTTAKIPGLDKHRIVSAKACGSFCAVTAERVGSYSVFVVTAVNNELKTRELPGQKEINFTTMPNGVCVFQTDDGLEVFSTTGSAIRKIPNPPFTFDMGLFFNNGVHFVRDDEIINVKLK